MTNHAHVIDIPAERRDEAVSVLRRAFAADPLMRYLYKGEYAGYERRLRAFFRYSCEVYLQFGWPLLGVVPRTRLAGVVGVKTPEQPPWPPALTKHYEQLAELLGDEASERMQQYAALSNRHFPNKPLFYVGLIGVRPESHGQGYARLLLDRVHALAAKHPHAIGVGLDTENPANVPLYESFGYELVGQEQIEQLTIYCMLRPR